MNIPATSRNYHELGLTHPYWKAEVVADSLAPHGVRLTSLWLRFPRPILVEFNTHRMLSRNASSRRAIPAAVTTRHVVEYPYVPDFQCNQPGMAAGALLDDDKMKLAKAAWMDLRHASLECADKLARLGVQKSWIGWALEKFLFVDVIVTATDWDNFFSQRIDKAAQPEFHKAALMVRAAMEASRPNYVDFREWHLAFIDEDDRKKMGVETLQKVSVARCARVSYANHDGVRDLDEDLGLFARLMAARPMHMSPFEHQATPTAWQVDGDLEYVGNFRGWQQLRKLIKGESGQGGQS